MHTRVKKRFRLERDLVITGSRGVSVVNRYGFPYTRTQRTYQFSPEVAEFIAENMTSTVKLGSHFRDSYFADFTNERDAVLFKLRFPEHVRDRV